MTANCPGAVQVSRVCVGVQLDPPLPLPEGERIEVRAWRARLPQMMQPSPYPLPCEGRGGNATQLSPY